MYTASLPTRQDHILTSSYSYFGPLSNLDLPVSTGRVQTRKECPINEANDTFYHAKYQVRILDAHTFLFPVINTLVQWTILFWLEIDCRTEFIEFTLNDILASIFSISVCLNCSTSGPAWDGAKGTGYASPALIQLDVPWCLSVLNERLVSTGINPIHENIPLVIPVTVFWSVSSQSSFCNSDFLSRSDFIWQSN